MIEPWFDPNRYAWIPGAAIGVAAGIMGALVGWLVPRGRARGFILWAWFSILAVALALVIAGIAALSNGQPWGIWYGLLLPGAIGTLVMSFTSPALLKGYREAEQRRLSAKDLL